MMLGYTGSRTRILCTLNLIAGVRGCGGVRVGVQTYYYKSNEMWKTGGKPWFSGESSDWSEGYLASP